MDKNVKTTYKKKKIEFVGSGFSQSIFPLVPYKVNYNNLKIGNEYYKSILGVKPKIALVNEQVFSISLVPIYKKRL